MPPSPSKLLNALPAAKECSTSSSPAMANHSMWDENNGCTLAGNESLSRLGMADAAGRAANDHPPGRKPTTPNIGNETTVEQMSSTASCSVDTTTCYCTTTIGKSRGVAETTGSSRRQTSTSNSVRYLCPPTAPPCVTSNLDTQVSANWYSPDTRDSPWFPPS